MAAFYRACGEYPKLKITNSPADGKQETLTLDQRLMEYYGNRRLLGRNIA